MNRRGTHRGGPTGRPCGTDLPRGGAALADLPGGALAVCLITYAKMHGAISSARATR